MPLTSFVTRFRNSSQVFIKDESSSSSGSLPTETAEIPERPVSVVPTTAGGTGTETAPNGAADASETRTDPPRVTIEGKETENRVKEEKKEQPLTLRQRFFSRHSTQKLPGPTARPMTSGNDGSMPGRLDLTKRFTVSKMDMTTLLQAIETTYIKHIEEAKFEPVRQLARTFTIQKEQYQWAEPSSTLPNYPPYLAVIPMEDRSGILQIFDRAKFIEVAVALCSEIPRGISSFLYGEPLGKNMVQLEAGMRRLSKQRKNVGNIRTIAEREDWYTDSVFAQQSFTGSNPTTITKATAEWVRRFMNAANAQGNKSTYTLLSAIPADEIYIQDNSFIRSAVHAQPDEALCSEDGKRFGCASVMLLHLNQEGQLHPLAVVCDYKGSMENSICIFNRRLSADAATDHEASDWPWRYAKLCFQVSDWTRHELAVHLNDCHFVEEATIVAAQRSFPTDHVVYNLLAPHWFRTLSVNAAARESLIPTCITAMTGLTTAQTHSFILSSYKRFNFPASYIPAQLSRRGFPPSLLSSQPFHNYVWAKNVSEIWTVLHKFVHSILCTVYHSHAEVLSDKSVQSWCDEMHSETGGQMPSFPDIATVDDLANAVVLCIHIATSMHNSVNYLQGYYQSFVPNKPSCLSSPLPAKLSELMQYTEKEFLAALPLKNEHLWRMCEQLPYLLSHEVDANKTLAAYARGMEHEAHSKRGVRWEAVGKAAKDFYEELMDLEEVFERNSKMMDDNSMSYQALHPTRLAVSILI
ncbi:lipoxygenase [Bisporella sp. PMI_857]|nr:lipoxygenase [Bisporella sp. PMI_857]